MMQLILKTIFLFMIIVHTAAAQSKYISQSSLIYDASGNRFIYEYNLNNDTPCKVEVQITYKGIAVNSPHIKGEFGECISRGDGKKIIWYCQQDIPNWTGNRNEVRFELKVVAPQSYSGALASGIVLLGAGPALLIPGVQKFGGALEAYAAYRDNTDPESSLWANQSRSDYYTETNNSYKNAQYMIATGSAAVAIGVSLLIKRANKKRKERVAKCVMNVNKPLQPVLYVSDNLGLGFRYSF